MLVGILPGAVAGNLDVITLLLIGFFGERHYVGRLSIFSNAAALNLYAARAPEIGFLFARFADLGLILGVIGFVAYVTQTSLGEDYYLVTFFGYSSATVALVLLTPTGLVWFLAAVFGGCVVNFYLLDVLKDHAVPV